MSFHIDDEGTALTITWLDGGEILDLSDAIVREITFKLPNNGALVGPETLTVPTGGEDGVAVFVIPTNYLTVAGVWEWQGYVEYADGKWHSDSGKFTVYPNLA